MQNFLRFFVLGRRRRSNIRVSFTCRQRGCECGWGKLMRMSCSYRSQLLIIAFAYYFPFIAHVARLDMPSLGGVGEKRKPLNHLFFAPFSGIFSFTHHPPKHQLLLHLLGLPFLFLWNVYKMAVRFRQQKQPHRGKKGIAKRVKS